MDQSDLSNETKSVKAKQNGPSSQVSVATQSTLDRGYPVTTVSESYPLKRNILSVPTFVATKSVFILHLI